MQDEARVRHRLTAALRRPSGDNRCDSRASNVGRESATFIPQKLPTTARDFNCYVAWKLDIDAFLKDQSDAEAILVDIFISAW